MVNSKLQFNFDESRSAEIARFYKVYARIPLKKRATSNQKNHLVRHTVVPEPGGPGGPLAPQYLADQLALYHSGRADYPHLLLLAPPMCFHLPASLGYKIFELNLCRNYITFTTESHATYSYKV